MRPLTSNALESGDSNPRPSGYEIARHASPQACSRMAAPLRCRSSSAALPEGLGFEAYRTQSGSILGWLVASSVKWPVRRESSSTEAVLTSGTNAA